MPLINIADEMVNPKIHICPICGYQWEHCQYGGHSCSKNLLKKMQKLIDLCFEISLTISNPNGVSRDGEKFNMTPIPDEKKAEWIAEQLRQCGFDTVPSGMSWGVLKQFNDKQRP